MGGLDYVAVISLREGKMRRRAFIRGGGVDQIEIGGGYAWIRFNQRLNRVALKDL